LIAIVDYGVGNVRAFHNIYKRLGIEARIVSSARELGQADRIVLPGVGAFDWAMRRLNESDMRSTLDSMVEVGGTPVLGVCVGMQMMARSSTEGTLDGLGWIPAEVTKLERSPGSSRLPHMGWNDVRLAQGHPLFKKLDSTARFYFLHSYHVVPDRTDDGVADVTYGRDFTAAVSNGNVHGVQFHPEKSHGWGVQLLKNFAGM
jgi:glutamine amidotransferase